MLGNRLIATELAAIWIETNDSRKGFLPVDCRWRPSIGDEVMALGSADLDRKMPDESDDRPMRQYLYGSLAAITEIVPFTNGSTRPWPMIRVAANWPGGMSGGPVFNRAGNVVGLVRTGFMGEEVATAALFSGWNVSEMTFPTIDPVNPGRLRCWIGIDGDDEAVAAARTETALASHPNCSSIARTMFATFDPQSREYTSLSPTPCTAPPVGGLPW